MAKSATIWRPLSGSGEVNNSNEGSYLETAVSSFLLLVTGGTDKLILGSTELVPKSNTAWSEYNG